MSSRHAEHDGEYRRLACVAYPRLLASRFASQYSDSYRIRRRLLVSLNAGGSVGVIGVAAFMHTLWISVWKQGRLSPRHGRHTAKVHTTADFASLLPDRAAGMREEQRSTSERTF